jgi:hypothetical protein
MTSPTTQHDITPASPDYSGPRITLHDRGGDVWVARTDDPESYPWVLVPVTLLEYIDQKCIRDNSDHDAAKTFNSALEAAFPDGPPGACGGYIDMNEPYIDPWPFCAVHGGSALPCTCDDPLALVADLPDDTPWPEARRILAERTGRS